VFVLVKSYYAVQKLRIQISNRLAQLSKLCRHRRGIRAEKGNAAEVWCELKQEWVKVKDCSQCEHFDPFVSKGEVKHLHEIISKRLKAIERGIAYDIKDAIKTHEPGIVLWTSGIRGIGPILTAGLIAVIRDPARFSNPSKVWKYFGLDVVDGKARRRKKGEKLTWNPFAKVLAWKIGEAFVKQGKFFREMYLEEKEKAKRKHPDWSKLHIHNHAKRVVAKRFLALFWAKWRQLKGLPVPKPYPVEHLGHTTVLTPEEAYWYDREE